MTRKTPAQTFYPKGTFTYGNRLSGESVPAAARLAVKGHENCPGCGVVLAARHVAAILERAKFSGTLRLLDQSGDDTPKALEKGGDVLYLCYDTQGAGGRPGDLFAAGKGVQYARLHGVPYVATASVIDLHDLDRKLTKAAALKGLRYIHIHAPCPAALDAPPRDTIRLARLAAESALFPVFEAENGKVIASRKIRNRMPVTQLLKPQERFARLSDEERLRLQAMVDGNIVEFDLLGREENRP